MEMKCFLTWRMLICTFPCTNIWNFLPSVKSENRKQSKHFTKEPIKVCSAHSIIRSREKLTNALSTQEVWAAHVAELLAFHFHTHTNRLQQPHCLQVGFLLEVWDRDKFSGSHLRISAKTVGLLTLNQHFTAVWLFIWTRICNRDGKRNLQAKGRFCPLQAAHSIDDFYVRAAWDQQGSCHALPPPAWTRHYAEAGCQSFLAFVHLPDVSYFEQCGEKKNIFQSLFPCLQFLKPYHIWFLQSYSCSTQCKAGIPCCLFFPVLVLGLVPCFPALGKKTLQL